ncbi:hypothetical protein ABZP36_033973 [Zizania latifolia]
MQNPSGIILQLYHAGQLAAALRAIESLPSSPAPLTGATYAALVAACSRLRSLHQGRRVHRHLVAFSSSSSCQGAQLASNTVLNNHLITMYGWCAAPDSARQVFDEMPSKNPVSWAAVIAAHVQNGRAGDALGLFSSMLRSGTAADQFALGSAVRACTELGDVGTGRQLHAHVIKSESGGDLIVQNALVTMYSKTGLVDEGCLNGGGQIKLVKGQSAKDLIQLLEGVYMQDVSIYDPFKNPIVKRLYNEWLGQPGSENAKRIGNLEYTKSLEY